MVSFQKSAERRGWVFYFVSARRELVKVGWTVSRKEGRIERFKGLAWVVERMKKGLSYGFFFRSSSGQRAKKRGCRGLEERRKSLVFAWW